MKEPEVSVYTPESSLAHPAAMLSDMFRDIRRGRELAWRLAVRDISAQYRQAALGILWAFILPLANTLTWIFLNSSGVVSIDGTKLPYAVYVFTGTILWAIFMEAVTAPLQITTASKPMLAKINFPREALIISGIYQTLFNAGIKIAVMLAALMIMGTYPGWTALLFPMALLSLILLGTTIGILITPIGILYSDIGKSLPIFLQFLMYLTPVVFPMPKEGLAATILELNPITPVILTARHWITDYPAEHLTGFLWVNASAMLLLTIVWIIYRLAMPILIERMSA